MRKIGLAIVALSASVVATVGGPCWSCIDHLHGHPRLGRLPEAGRACRRYLRRDRGKHRCPWRGPSRRGCDLHPRQRGGPPRIPARSAVGFAANAPASLQVHFAHINGGVRMLGGNGEFSTVEDNEEIDGGATMDGDRGSSGSPFISHMPSADRDAQQQRYGRPGRERVCDEHDRRQSRLS